MPGFTTTNWLASSDGKRSSYDMGIGTNSGSFFVDRFLPMLELRPGLALSVGRGWAGAEVCGGAIVVAQTSLTRWLLSWKSLQRGPKNLGDVVRTGGYHVRPTEVLAKSMLR